MSKSQTTKIKVPVESFANRYLDRVDAQFNAKTDYRLAQLLGVTPQAIYKMRRGGAMSAATAARIAYLLKIDALKVIAECEIERDHDNDLFWRQILGKVAAIAIVALGAGASMPSAEASPSPAAPRVEALCIM